MFQGDVETFAPVMVRWGRSAEYTGNCTALLHLLDPLNRDSFPCLGAALDHSR